MLRLYLPVVAAVGFAYALVRLVPRHPTAAASWWLALHRSPVHVVEAGRNAVLVRGTTWLNSALWSLRWEVYFSLLLPLFVLLLVRSKAAAAAWLATLLALIAVGFHEGRLWLVYLPVFGVGVVEASLMDRLDAWGAAFDRMAGAVRRDIVAGVVLLLVSPWWLGVVPTVVDRPPASLVRWLPIAGQVLTVTGAALLVWLFASTSSGCRLGSRPVVRWLGKRSFSLYLVHEPIVVTVAYLLHGTTNAALVASLALPLSLAVAECFGRWVETPSLQVSRRVGRWIRRVRPAHL
jgi:peptidoglycan/LPS O-acetylase OafA/YrhL